MYGSRISKEGIDYIKKENGDMVLSKDHIEEVTNRMGGEILKLHSDVCYLLNFGELGQERANELSEHYKAIRDILVAYVKEGHGPDTHAAWKKREDDETEKRIRNRAELEACLYEYGFKDFEHIFFGNNRGVNFILDDNYWCYTCAYPDGEEKDSPSVTFKSPYITYDNCYKSTLEKAIYSPYGTVYLDDRCRRLRVRDNHGMRTGWTYVGCANAVNRIRDFFAWFDDLDISDDDKFNEDREDVCRILNDMLIDLDVKPAFYRSHNREAVKKEEVQND